MDELNVIVGTKIRTLREYHGYSREKFAELAGINDKFLYEVETGKKGLSVRKMYSISRTLGVSMDYLVTDDKSTDLSSNNPDLSFSDVLNKNDLIYLEQIIHKLLLVLE